MLDSDRRLADHFGGKVSQYVVDLKLVIMRISRCILDTTSSVTCSRSSRRSETADELGQLLLLLQERVPVIVVAVTIGRKSTGTAGMTVTDLDMSESALLIVLLRLD